MIDLFIDPGHGGDDSGATGPTGLREADCNLDIALKVGAILRAAGVSVGFTRTVDTTVSLAQRAARANVENARYFLSIHNNGAMAPEATGTETHALASGGSGEKLANAVQASLVSAIGLPSRGVKFSNFQVLRETTMPAALVEVCFITNPAEEALLKNGEFIARVANGIAHGVMDFLGISVAPENGVLTPIMGTATHDAKSLAAFLLDTNAEPKINCTAAELAEYFIAEGKIEGVRGDIAFCQAIHETGWFRFTGDVKPEQNNYAGIGATGGGAGGASFATPAEGVRAQIQHLKAYASKEPLETICVDPRFNLVTRGIAPNWTDLNGRWAVPGTTYGQSILLLYSDLYISFPLVEPVATTHWAEEHWVYLNSHGIEVSERRFDDSMTRGEMLALLARYHQQGNV